MRFRSFLSRPGLAASIAAALSFVSLSSAASPALHVEGNRFVDGAGRTVVLRGVNAAGNSKIPYFTPFERPGFFDPLPKLGYDVVRLLFNWEAYEPAKGQYDASYLDYYATAAKAAGDQGLFVIVDFHQDAFSRASVQGCGDGFPLWAVPSEVTPAEPNNGPSCEKWGVMMKSDQGMLASFSDFYSDKEGVRTAYLAMVTSVAARLASHSEVIGYDMLNEPWGDEVTEIGPLYEDAATAIRGESPDAILFVSPRALTSAGNGTQLQKPTFDNFAYSPHFYDATVAVLHDWSGVQPDTAFQIMRSTADAWGVPLFLGEFGASGTTVDGAEYMVSMFEHLDQRLESGAQWCYTPAWTPTELDAWNREDYSIVDDAGQMRPNFVDRAYPKAISGVPTSFKYDPGEAPSMTLAWEHDPALGSTVIYVPIREFWDDPVIQVTGDAKCTYADLWVTCTSQVKGPLSVTISAQPAIDAQDGPSDNCSTSAPGAPSRGALFAGLFGIAAALSARRRRA